ncbi:MAG: Cyclomaltodextrin glucanotransferase [Myxococcales bacterium]|nr:Cyclomaltodextrin glucanotransferase [Myxococcales bacterium]
MTLRLVTLPVVVAAALFIVGGGCHVGAPATGAIDLATPAGDEADLGASDDLASRDDAGSAVPVDWSRQVIYLALVDRFTNGDSANDSLGLAGCLDANDPQKYHGGDFAGLQARLPYLRELGVTALWVTPAYQQAAGPPNRCGYHGYWADFAEPDDGAVEPRFGGAPALTALVDALHAADMTFILDMVVNHPGDHARVVTQHPDWFHDPATCAQLGSAAIYCPYRTGISDFAQEKPAVADYLSSLSAGWTQRFALDGIRMDTAKYVLPAYFHDSFFPRVRAVRPLFVVGEVFSENVAELKPYLDAGFDSTFNFPLRGALAAAVGHEQSLDAVATVLDAEQAQLGPARARMLVNMIDNHDTARFTNEPGATVANDEIRRRLQLALAIAFIAPGIPQLYAGDELGLYGANDPDNRRDMPPWAWTAADRATAMPPAAIPNAEATFAFVQRLVSLRRTHAALADGDYRELWRPNGSAAVNVFAFLREAAGEKLVFVVNGGAAAATVKLMLHGRIADATTLDELLAFGAPPTLTAAADSLDVTLPPKTAALYRAQ